MSEPKDELEEALRLFDQALQADSNRVKELFEKLDAAATGYTNAEIFEAVYALFRWCLWQKRRDLEVFAAAQKFTAIAIRSMADGIEDLTPTMEVPS